MILSMIVATGPKGEIGLDNKLLWHIPEDLKNFKKMTTGKSVVMGRKTFESIGKPLPNRRNIVVTRDTNFNPSGVEVINDPLMAFDLALENDSDNNESELVVIGGAEIYNIYLPYVQKIYLTQVSYEGNADTFFPKLNPSEWKTVSTEKFDSFQFSILEKL